MLGAKHEGGCVVGFVYWLLLLGALTRVKVGSALIISSPSVIERSLYLFLLPSLSLSFAVSNTYLLFISFIFVFRLLSNLSKKNSYHFKVAFYLLLTDIERNET